MFLELLTDIRQNKQGWANFTQADFIFYGDAVNRVFYIFPVAAMREYLQTHIGEYRTQTASDINQYTGQTTKQSLGAIVPIDDFMAAVKTQVLDINARLKIGPQKGPY